MFARRAERFRALANGHELKPYLVFLAELSAVQHSIQDGLAAPELPAADAIALARQHAMPPLDRSRFTADAACEAALSRLLASAASLEMPAPAKAALFKLRAADARNARPHDAIRCWRIQFRPRRLRNMCSSRRPSRCTSLGSRSSLTPRASSPLATGSVQSAAVRRSVR